MERRRASDFPQELIDLLNGGNYPFDIGDARCSVPKTGRRKAGAQ